MMHNKPCNFITAKEEPLKGWQLINTCLKHKNNQATFSNEFENQALFFMFYFINWLSI